MKKIVLFVFIFSFISCNNDDDSETINQLHLSENIEVYEENLIENSLVLAIENGGNTSYLLNKQGQRLHQWDFDTNLGNDLELLPDGNLIGMFKVFGPDISFGGSGGTIKILNSNSGVEWQYTYASNNYIAHHDVELLPNGNVLFIAWERVYGLVAQTNGVNVADDIFPETLVEVNPTTNQIVWKWNSFDHIIQDFDANDLNFGSINENPQRIDINYNSSANGGDIMHANGIDYDETNDIIYLSVNNYSEIWVIDHSTTTIEAASNTGGNYNKGGDLVYRFGNPEAYNSIGNRLFYNNHFPNLIEKDVPGKDNMLVFVNKDNNLEQSAVYELELPVPFNLLPNTNNEPNIVWEFTDPTMYSRIISGAVRLKNGNTLICDGAYGFWEITQDGVIAWKYNSQNTNMWRGYNYYQDDNALSFLDLQ
ncbi:aryl-sulfate sulfotransferase [Psychroserpens ponticola]|uniref:Aryl-sulfate sulfotransferase n=1 Tax=Psychroserpens ponticola TaxID=2932268 RepID=A0ABY7RYN1_9FLAO|nr:aryl-sulfate sulfotransferase [Psychroserpens ponticola]WCO02167.1 aryl-sulfate sulfotransferase [Psychroserpens ponticola]